MDARRCSCRPETTARSRAALLRLKNDRRLAPSALACRARALAPHLHVGQRVPSDSRRALDAAQAVMISRGLIGLVQCPDCAGALALAAPIRRRAAVRPSVCDRARGLSRPAAAHGVRRTDEVPRRGAARRRAPRVDRAAAARLEDSQRHASARSCSPALAIGCSTSGAAAGARSPGIADSGAALTGHRHRAVLRAAKRSRPATSCSATFGALPIATARSTRRGRSTCSSTCRGRRSSAMLQRSEPRAGRRAARCSCIRTCARTAGLRAACGW